MMKLRASKGREKVFMKNIKLSMVKGAGNQQPMQSGMYLSLKVGQLDP